jgi:putative (di)nucleoside polyphosphate hydrolase
MRLSDSVPRHYRKGVGALVFNSDGRVLVARRLGTADAWQLPQGGLHPGEDPRIAVRRELIEEIGTDRVEIIAESSEWLRYDLPAALCGKVWKGKYQGQEQRWFAFCFTGEDGRHRRCR